MTCHWIFSSQLALCEFNSAAILPRATISEHRHFPENADIQTAELLIIWDAMALLWRHCSVLTAVESNVFILTKRVQVTCQLTYVHLYGTPISITVSMASVERMAVVREASLRRQSADRDDIMILQWRHNEFAGVSNHQPHYCLLNGLFRRKSKKTSKLSVTGLVRGIHRWPVNSPHKGPVTRKMFQFDDVTMKVVRNGNRDPFQYKDRLSGIMFHYRYKNVMRRSYFYNR